MKIGNGKTGYETFQIKQRYADLSEPFFAFLKEQFESGDKKDKMWAAEQLGKAYTRMIPTEITGEGGGAIIIQVSKEGAEKYGITASSTSDNSIGQA